MIFNGIPVLFHRGIPVLRPTDFRMFQIYEMPVFRKKKLENHMSDVKNLRKILSRTKIIVNAQSYESSDFRKKIVQ